MCRKADTLRELYVAVAGTEMTTEPQEESPSHEPLGEAATEFERTVSDATRQDGLADAVK